MLANKLNRNSTQRKTSRPAKTAAKRGSAARFEGTVEAQTKAFVNRLYRISPVEAQPEAVAAAKELSDMILEIFEEKS